MTSPFLTTAPRRTFNSWMTPAARAIAMARRSASVRPDRMTRRACGTTSTGVTATRKAGASACGAVSRGAGASLWAPPNRPEPIHTATASTIRIAAMRLAVMTHSTRRQTAG